MKERPILFSTPMVQALIEGRKTQTRRIIKPQPTFTDGFWRWPGKRPKAKKATGAVSVTGGENPMQSLLQQIDHQCTYGRVGDRLWVKETFQWVDNGDDSGYVYKATDPDWETTEEWCWKPSLFMPRAASRILLEITEIKAERLHDITVIDCVQEGMKGMDPHFAFFQVWESINGKGSWKENSFVWAITFKIISACTPLRV